MTLLMSKKVNFFFPASLAIHKRCGGLTAEIALVVILRYLN